MGRSEKSLSHDGSDEPVHAITEVPPEPDWDPEVERSLLKKIDWALIPIFWLMSLLNYMDRANLGNAAIAGLNADLKLSSSQFSMAIVTFYFGYIAYVAFSGMILPRVRPSLYVPGIMIGWGAVTIGMGWVKTYPQLLVLRCLIGALEAGFAPGVTFIFSCWYLPDELGKRSSLFVTSSVLGGGFGGLIAGGVMANLEGAQGIRGWRWLFIVEGTITVAVALAAIFILPDYPATSVRLTAEEKEVAVKRLQRAGIMVNADRAKAKYGLWDAFVMAMKDWRSYAYATAAAFVSATLLMGYFYPILVKGLGYTDTVKAQYMTVPIWGVGFVFAICTGWVVDRMPQYRALFIVGGLGILTLFAVITCAVFDFKARYAFIALMTGGVWGAFSQNVAYCAELFQDRPPEVRGVTLGLMAVLSNTGNIYGAYLWPAENAPKHLLGFGMVAAMGLISALLYFMIWFLERRRHKREAAAAATTT